jgi:hypothetical protein
MRYDGLLRDLSGNKVVGASLCAEPLGTLANQVAGTTSISNIKPKNRPNI